MRSLEGTDLDGRSFNFLLGVTSVAFPRVAAVGLGGDEEREGRLCGDWLQVDAVQIRFARGRHARKRINAA